jgi:exopolysaccharide production protein ExoZ
MPIVHPPLQSPADPDARPRLRTLDFLRGLAILGVVAIHSGQTFPSHIAALDFVFASGWVGVQVFYFVSTLTMCHMWRQREGEAHPIRSFYIRRFLRIAPLFWIAMLVYLALNGVGPSFWAPFGIGPLDIVLTASFLHGFWPDAINSVVPGGWSIAVEMTFYALFPLTILALGARRFAYLGLAIAVFLVNVLFLKSWVSAALLAGPFQGQPVIVDFFAHLYFPVQAPIFLAGCFMFFSLDRRLDWKTIAALWLWVGLGALADYVHPVREFHYLLIYLALGAFVYACLKMKLKWAPLEYLGRNSYAMYLSHFLVLAMLARFAPIHEGVAALFVSAAATALLSCAVARATYRLIERPSHRLATWLTHGGARARKLEAGLVASG